MNLCQRLAVVLFVFVTLGVFLSAPSRVRAYTITSDPTYIIINLADDFYFADWDADEASWSAQVKPMLVKRLEEIKTTVGVGSEDRQLAWSTLLEYTDFPLQANSAEATHSAKIILDSPGPSSPYVIQARRIMEVAEAVDLPVFMPLNGYQWWNQAPELWNHWDPDGTQTPGCGNDEYDQIERYEGDQPVYKCKFPLLRNPAFRQRFIAGYNPDNKWNVEWQNWQTPMRLNWRNWGAGGFQLAPPPNLVDHDRSTLSYHDFQQARYQAIIDQIVAKLDEWQAAGKTNLFAGITIGTEVSLNASVTQADEFVPYGYRAVQDLACDGEMACDEATTASGSALAELRAEVVNGYLTELAKYAVRAGIPKQRVYTHVWSETREGDPRFMDYFSASINPYARPTLSLYGDAQDPLALPLLTEALGKNGQPVWGAAEFSTDKTPEAWQKALSNTLANEHNPAKLIDVYNWKEHVGTPAIAEVKAFLAGDGNSHLNYSLSAPVATSAGLVSEILPLGESVQVDPEQLSWQLLNPDQATDQQVLFFSGMTASFDVDNAATVITLPPTEMQLPLPSLEELQPGVYQWLVVRHSADSKVSRYSEPRTVVVSQPVYAGVPQWQQQWFIFTHHVQEWAAQLGFSF